MTNTPPPPNPADAMMTFWKDAWSRMGAAASAAGAAAAPGTGTSSPFPNMPGMPPMPGMPGASGTDPMAWMPTPEMVRRMQSAFLDAMAGSAEQYMRSPQFLESVRQSIDSATQMRQQVEELVRRNISGVTDAMDLMKTPGERGGDVLAALTQLESRLAARLDEIDSRLGRLESADDTQAGATTDGGAPRPRRSGRGRAS